MKKASSIIDYTILIFVVVATLAATFTYVKRGLMGKFKQTGDTVGFGRQYEAGTPVRAYCYVSKTNKAAIACDQAQYCEAPAGTEISCGKVRY